MSHSLQRLEMDFMAKKSEKSQYVPTISVTRTAMVAAMMTVQLIVGSEEET